MNNNNGHWGNMPTPTESEENGLQSRPMGLKIHYTFDKDGKENCLARWPHVLPIQTIPLDEKNLIGVVDLRTCLQSIAQCSPELAGDNERDYTVYAFDYSEPDTPLVGQGMFSCALLQNNNAAPQLVTGRVTKNLLAIFGKGVQETLEVKLKLTAIPKVVRVTPTVHAPTPMSVNHGMSPQFPPSLHHSSSMMSETNEWNAFVQANPNLGPAPGASIPSPATMPIQPFSPAYETRNDMTNQYIQPMPTNGGSRPASRSGSHAGSRPGSSMGPAAHFQGATTPQASNLSQVFTQSPQQQQAVVAPVNVSTTVQPRPSSRPSSRASTGRPRGRPRKNPLPVEGSTSGYEDGTDGDEPPRAKKRAKTTKVERSNTATFGSAPESLRVAASTSGSLRSFRPVSLGGEGAPGSHLQEVPRAPTPVPAHRSLPGPVQQHAPPPSMLRRQSSSNFSEQNGAYTNSFLDVNRPTSFGPDARSPTDSLAPSPSQYSEGPSPADIGSSPPVPRSVMYPSARSSPAPSSPILPPMRAQQIDSGFMSGGVDHFGSRLDDEEVGKMQTQPPAPAAETSKPKPKPRKSRAKKQQAPKTEQSEQLSQGGGLIIQTETPGPPELLPTTSIYNPPNQHYHKQAEEQAMNAMDTSFQAENERSLTPQNRFQVPTLEIVVPQESNETNKAENIQSQDDFEDLEKAFMDGLGQQNMHSFEGLATDTQTFSPSDMQMQSEIKQTIEREGSARVMDSQSVPRSSHEGADEPELPPMVPASDPVCPRSYNMGSEPPHPQTDAAYNKNAVKKQTIKQRLEEALAAGRMPPFCSNCGAIETPTWRKIYKQTQTGVPSFHVYSDKPGHVTAINILTHGSDGAITSYEMVKKCLGPNEDKTAWNELILCNPCGLWFSKWKQPRPADKWEKDQQRLGQTRKRKDPSEKGSRAPRPRKPRTKSGSQANLTSDAGLMTDPLGFDNGFSPKDELPNPFESKQLVGNEPSGTNEEQQGPGSSHSRGSMHSRGSGKSPASPIALDDEFGTTRRLLFPSPRKEGEQKILGEVAVNVVQTAHDFIGSKENNTVANKENTAPGDTDDMTDLFGTPARPSTPPPKSIPSGTFKTPSRLTPSHRPVTRSVSKSIRSVRSIRSPAQGLAVQPTPSRTPRSHAAIVRRSPRVAGLHSQLFDDSRPPESPMTKSINKLLAEAGDFIVGSVPSGSALDIVPFSKLQAERFGDLTHPDNVPQHPLDAPWDFGHLLGTDEVMPSSPPTLSQHISFGADDIDIWEHFQTLCNNNNKTDEGGQGRKA
ncbi:hypothetical protein G7054_g1902 [Neopestalotiopsis clavispora]|nr:hypothetical protein G7054_g1902 [Neopestalotiopsis clavispora]